MVAAVAVTLAISCLLIGIGMTCIGTACLIEAICAYRRHERVNP